MIILMIIGAVLLRLVPHVPNFAPITAIAIFSGANISKRSAILVPMLSLLISDYLLLYINPFSSELIDFSRIYPVTVLLHSTSLYVYVSFMISSLIGLSIRKHQSWALFASIIASIQFFLITNYGVWAGGMYERGLGGLTESYLMGLPFFKWTLLGDLFYTTIFFRIYELARRANRAKLVF